MFRVPEGRGGQEVFDKDRLENVFGVGLVFQVHHANPPDGIGVKGQRPFRLLLAPHPASPQTDNLFTGSGASRHDGRSRCDGAVRCVRRRSYRRPRLHLRRRSAVSAGGAAVVTDPVSVFVGVVPARRRFRPRPRQLTACRQSPFQPPCPWAAAGTAKAAAARTRAASVTNIFFFIIGSSLGLDCEWEKFSPFHL